MELSHKDSIVYDDQGVPVDPVHRTEFSFFGNGEFKPPPGRVVGVYYDKQRRIWRANWREGDVGKRKTKNFSVDDYGFEEARRLAIEYRLMKITEIAQMELNCPEIDRIRLSTCRAPAQPSAGDRRKRLSTGPDTPRKRQRGKSALPDADPYLYSGQVPAPVGDFFDPNDQYGVYWTMPYYYNQQAQQQPQNDSNYMWYYSTDVLYNLYNQTATPGQNEPINRSAAQTYASLMTDIGPTDHGRYDHPTNVDAIPPPPPPHQILESLEQQPREMKLDMPLMPNIDNSADDISPNALPQQLMQSLEQPIYDVNIDPANGDKN